MNEESAFWENIQPVCILRGWLRSGWAVILVVLASWLSVQGGYIFTYQPQYMSSATVAVNAKGDAGAYASLDLTARMAQVFAGVFQSESFREAAQCAVTASVLPETNLITVQVTDSDPRAAFLALKNVLEIYPDFVENLFQNADLRVIRSPTVPLAPYNTADPEVYGKKVCFAAAVVSALLLTALLLRRDTVQTAQAAQHKLDGRVLGVIGHARRERHRLFKKSKVKEAGKAAALLTDPFVPYSYIEAYQALCAALEHRMRRGEKKVLLVTGAAENEGKSSVASNLALAFSMRGRRVLLVDLDLRKPALHKIFAQRAAAKDGMTAFLENPENRKLPIFPVRKYGFSLCVTEAAAHPEKLLHSGALKDFLQAVQRSDKFDCVILDSPPMLLSADAEALADFSDLSVLTVRQDYTPAALLNDCADRLREAKAEFGGFILNDFCAVPSFWRKLYSSK